MLNSVLIILAITYFILNFIEGVNLVYTLCEFLIFVVILAWLIFKAAFLIREIDDGE